MAATAGELLEALDQPPPAGWDGLARRGWPGALTLVLPARGAVAPALNPGGASLGLRVPARQPALDLLRRTGPLATTSANPRPAPGRAAGLAGRLRPGQHGRRLAGDGRRLARPAAR